MGNVTPEDSITSDLFANEISLMWNRVSDTHPMEFSQ